MSEGMSKKKTNIRPAMNVTPLVDVVLVLLIIFMIVVPMMENDIQIALPSIFNVDEESRGRADPFTLAVSQNGDMYFEQEQLSPQQLEERLKQANQDEPNRRLVLRADSKTRYGKVRSLFKICQQIGFPGISLRMNELAGERSDSSERGG